MAEVQKTILGSESLTRTASAAALRPFGYERRTAGTRDLALSEELSEQTGYWKNPGAISSKPPRWIIQIDATKDELTPALATDSTGAPFPGGSNVGYINNGQGKCALASFRLMPAVKVGNDSYFFVPGWEWIIQFAFQKPLPVGTSGDTLSDFDVLRSELGYKGRADSKSNVKIAHIGLVMTMAKRESVTIANERQLSYEEVTDSIVSWLSSGTCDVAAYDAQDPRDLARLEVDLVKTFSNSSSESSRRKVIEPTPELIGISEETFDLINASLACGKKHLIFYGPPGTGKTTLAQYVAEQINESLEDEQQSSHTLLTASSSWTSQDLLGGYQPIGGGKIAFIKGALLKNFDKPLIIDELNRCSIDKVIGPLFTVLSGQTTTLPYRIDAEDPESPSYKIYSTPSDQKLPNEFRPGINWSLICTLNIADKNQLEQVSVALARRFTWIRISAPKDPHSFITSILAKIGFLKSTLDSNSANFIGDIWITVNEYRELGAAPYIDLIRIIRSARPSIDFLKPLPTSDFHFFISAFNSSLVPLLDGLSHSEMIECASKITNILNLDTKAESLLTKSMAEFSF
jgi:hypothetical protein